MRADRFKTSLIATICAAALAGSAIGQLTAQQAPAGGAAQGQNPAAGRGGGAAASGVFTSSDINKDGAITRGELMATLEKWFSDSDAARSGRITQDQLLTALNAALPQPPPAAGGRGRGQNCGGATQTPCPDHVTAMTAALPATAPAKPARARKVLVLAKADGFVHSSIPLAAATVEALGTKTKAWSTTISWDPADINEANLKQYDAVFLDSTTGCFLDDRADAAATTARRAALLAFVRGGKGLGGIHAATDSYHQSCAGGRGRGAAPAQAAPGAAPGAVTTQAAAPPAPRAGGAGRGGGAGAQLAAQIVTLADKNTDQQLSLTEMDVLANDLFDKLDTEKVGRVSQADFTARFDAVLPQPARGGRGGGGAAAGAPGAPAAAQGGGRGAVRDWPEFNTMIGGMFLAHPFQHVWVKVEDPKSPITAAFKGQTFEITDETYTMQREVYSRENMRVLLSIDVDRMTPEEKARENRPWDHDYALSWIRREGRGRVFYSAHGHNEAVYAMKPMLEHYLAGIQYILGDLKADDSPSVKPGSKK